MWRHEVFWLLDDNKLSIKHNKVKINKLGKQVTQEMIGTKKIFYAIRMYEHLHGLI